MEYANLIKDASEKLGGARKQAADLATMLDSPIFAIDKDGENVDARTDLFDLLCAILQRHHVDLPPLEEKIWRSKLRRAEGKQKKSGHKRLAALQATLPAVARKDARVRTLLDFVSIFPDLCANDPVVGIPLSELQLSEIVAELQRTLVDDLGLLPLRPDYTKVEIPTPPDVHPTQPTRILVVDDSAQCLATSGIALAGIPNVTLVFYHHVAGWTNKADEKAAVLSRVTKAVAALSPDIILMDEGLGEIDGHNLVTAIREHGYKGWFVANTGGNPEVLTDLGCFENFQKGKEPRGVIEAIRRIS